MKEENRKRAVTVSLRKKISDGSFLLWFLILLLVGLAVLFSFVMCCEAVEEWVGCLLGLHKKNEILKFLGIGMGGVVLVLQAVIANRRAKAMEDAANEQAKANQNTEQGQRQERLRSAIEHLGHEKVSVRLGGTYELFHLARDSKEEEKELRQTVLDILCAHIRQTTGEKEYKEKHKSKPSEEIQSLLTLLFVQEHQVFTGLRINLQESWLNGVNLREARLEKAILTKARIRGANLSRARLQGAVLSGALLQGVDLSWARLQKAVLMGERQGVSVTGVFEHDPTGVQLQGANLGGARLQGAVLSGVQLQGANLGEAGLQGVVLTGPLYLGGVTSYLTSLAFEERIRERSGKEADLTGVIFVGGLNQEETNSLLEGFSDEEAKELRERLAPHIDKTASPKPEDIRVITTAYTKEKAEQWIDEYNEATKDIKD